MTLMETAQFLGNLSDIVGAIVIVITLIYLSVQIRQNTNALHAQSRQSLVAAGQAECFAALQHPEVFFAQVKPDLTPEEHMKLSFWLAAVMRAREFAWLQYRSGVVDEVQCRTEAMVIQAILESSNCRTWWQSVGRSLFPAEFVKFVDELMRDHPVGNELHRSITGWTKTAQLGAGNAAGQ